MTEFVHVGDGARWTVNLVATCARWGFGADPDKYVVIVPVELAGFRPIVYRHCVVDDFGDLHTVPQNSEPDYEFYRVESGRTKMGKRRARRPDKTDHTLESIRAKCTECGDCWLWNDGLSHGVPVLSHRGKPMAVRKYLIEVLAGEPLDGRNAVASCLDKRCVAPEHATAMTRAELQSRYNEKLKYGSHPVRRAKLARAYQKRVLAKRAEGATETRKARAPRTIPIGSPWFGLVK